MSGPATLTQRIISHRLVRDWAEAEPPDRRIRRARATGLMSTSRAVVVGAGFVAVAALWLGASLMLPSASRLGVLATRVSESPRG